MIQRVTLIGLVLVLLCPFSAHAGAPLDTAKNGVDKVIAVAGDPSLQGDQNKAKKEEKVRKIIGEFFDFEILSRYTLGKDWKKFNSEQQKEFTTLYRSLLENVYMDRILMYTNEKVEFTKELEIAKNRAEVQSKLIRGGTETPIHYRMVIVGGKWKVYDVVIEGVSMVKNYRSQFNDMLIKQSPDELIEFLRKKIKEA